MPRRALLGTVRAGRRALLIALFASACASANGEERSTLVTAVFSSFSGMQTVQFESRQASKTEEPAKFPTFPSPPPFSVPVESRRAAVGFERTFWVQTFSKKDRNAEQQTATKARLVAQRAHADLYIDESLLPTIQASAQSRIADILEQAFVETTRYFAADLRYRLPLKQVAHCWASGRRSGAGPAYVASNGNDIRF